MTSPLGTGGFRIVGETGGDQFRRFLGFSSAGDVNSDGIDDIIVGAPSNSSFSDGSLAGAPVTSFSDHESRIRGLDRIWAMLPVGRAVSSIVGDAFRRPVRIFSGCDRPAM